MALRNQPYLPLYIQDYLTDEKLNMCSWQAQGIYIKILCILHKQKEYGQIKTKAKQKQNKSKISDFAYILTKQIPCQMNDMENALNELVENDVLNIEDDKLYQKRMIKDGNISIARSNAGSIGGKVGRNSGTKRYYNEPGYLYLIYDKDDKESFKMGISKKPEKRIKGIIRKSERPNLAFRKKWYVKDMGLTEQSVLDYFDDIRDGEWIYGDYDIKEIENQINSIVKTLIKTKSKLKQIPEDEYEDEYEYKYEDESEDENVNENKTQSKPVENIQTKEKVKKIENIIKDESEIRNIVTEFYNYQHSVFSDLVKVNEKKINDGILIINKLIRTDNFELDKIKDVLKFIVHDEFWANKVLSLNGLRKKSKNGNTKFVNALLSSVNNQKSNVAAFNQAAAEEFLKNE